MEIWKDIIGFEGYQVSNRGRVRSFWRKKHYPTGYGTYRYLSDEPTILSTSDDGNGYQKLMLYSTRHKHRACKKVHRLVAEAFIPKPKNLDDYTVDHIISGPEGKLNNSVENLRWISRSENIKKAYRDGMCDERIKRQCNPIIVTDLWTGDELYFESSKHASNVLGIDKTEIYHSLNKDNIMKKRYVAIRLDGKERLLYGAEYFNFFSGLPF